MRIGLVGAGSMAAALARGLGEPALVFDPVPERAAALASELGGAEAASNAELAAAADLVILCHKPADLRQVAEEMQTVPRAIASIVAATPTSAIEAAYPGAAVYRFIPNIPVEVGRGTFCYAPGASASQGPEQEVLALFARCGTVTRLDEPLIEPAMAIMSCGPAFLALVVEALAGAGARHGIDPRQATELVVGAMAGTAAYLEANDLDAPALRARVATPGGLTEKGLALLEQAGVPGSFDAAVDLVVEGAR